MQITKELLEGEKKTILSQIDQHSKALQACHGALQTIDHMIEVLEKKEDVK